jgi:ABC-type nitrate/sulfonate/bicarbonate transport system ATPase subunit
MIKVNNLQIKFDKKVLFDGYNTTFADNKVYCILGKSGCGKSTLLRIIAGLLKPQGGEIICNDKIVDKPIKDIFMMHQTYSNFPWKNCLENVLFPLKVQGKLTEQHKKEAIEILKQVGLEGNEDKYPHELSGGMKQRLALARVLITRPPVILMDEPLSALDPKTRSQMQDLVLDMHNKTKNIVIMVTHDPDEAKKMADEIITL